MTRVALLRLAAVGIGLLLFWGTCEVVCRLIFAKTVSYDVEMWRYARDVKTTGLTPGLRFEHRPNVCAQLMGVTVEISSDGLRDREFSMKKPSATFRIAVVGDSVTFGWGVPQSQTYPKRLEALLNKQRPLGPQVAFEIINFGVGNYSAEDAAAMLQHKTFKYVPDMVIYGAFINDAELAREVSGSTTLLQHSLAAVLVWSRLDRLWRQLDLREDYQEYYHGLYKEGGAGRQQVWESLQKMMSLCRQAKIPLVVALLPELHDSDGVQFAAIRQFYQSAATESGAHFIDLKASLSGNSWRRYWVSADDAHPNATACDLFAQMLSSELSLRRFR